MVKQRPQTTESIHMFTLGRSSLLRLARAFLCVATATLVTLGITMVVVSESVVPVAAQEMPAWAEPAAPPSAHELYEHEELDDGPPDPPPDPVPIDGGFAVLALAGGAYGIRRLRAALGSR